jgi:hypothetical protein
MGTNRNRRILGRGAQQVNEEKASEEKASEEKASKKRMRIQLSALNCGLLFLDRHSPAV